MVTGQSYMTSSPSFELKNTTYKLSIQLNLNGFSFCITTSDEKIITTENHFSNENLLSEQELYIKLIEAFKTKPELQAKFEEVIVTYTNELYAFVPENLYDSGHKELYFKFSVKTLVTDFIGEDKLKSLPIVNLFIPFININNYLLEHFKQFNYHHHSGILVDYLITKNTTNTFSKIYLFFHAQHFDVIVLKENNLSLCNTFKKQTKEDVLYYLLFVIEQVELSPDTVIVELLNSVPKEYFDLLYKYIRNINTASEESTNLIHRLALNI